MVNMRALEAIADSDFQTEIGQFNVEINVPPRILDGKRLQRARGGGPRQPQPRRGARADGRRAHDDHRHPADRPGAAPDGATPSAQPALPAAERADLRRPRRGPRDLDRGRRAPVDVRRHDRPRGGLHERAAAPPGRARGLRRPLERRPGDRRAAGRGGGELAVLLRPASSGARRASRCSSRRPTPVRRS